MRSFVSREVLLICRVGNETGPRPLAGDPFGGVSFRGKRPPAATCAVDGSANRAAEAALVWTKACGMGVTLSIAVPSHMSEVPLFGEAYALSRHACNHDKAPASNRASGTRAKSTPPLPRFDAKSRQNQSSSTAFGRATARRGACAPGPSDRAVRRAPLSGQAWRGQARALRSSGAQGPRKACHRHI